MIKKIILKKYLGITSLIILTFCLSSINSFGQETKPHITILLKCQWGPEEDKLGYLPEEIDDKGFLNPGEGPRSFAIDKDGNIYITDTLKNRVVKFDKSGKYLSSFGFGWFWGKEPLTLTTLSGKKFVAGYTSSLFPNTPLSILGKPTDITVDDKGYVYVSTFENDGYVFKFDSYGRLLQIIDKLGVYESDKIWDIYFRELSNGEKMIGIAYKMNGHSVSKHLFYDSSMNYIEEELDYPDGFKRRYRDITRDKNGVIVAKEYTIEVLEPDGKTKRKIVFTSLCKDLNVPIDKVYFIYVDKKGNFYFQDDYFNIFRIDQEGKIKGKYTFTKIENAVSMAMGRPFFISPDGEIYEMIPLKDGLQIIKISF